MQPRNNNNRMMQRNNKNRHGGRSNNNQNRSGGGGGGGNNPNRGRINISHVTNQRDKFQNQARDAMHSGDRVLSEYYLQHADHYQRLINEYNEEQEARRAQFQDQATAPAAQETAAPEEPFVEEAAAPAALPLPPAIPLDRDDLEPKEIG
jgi:Domain of unknown function (DUF4167)